MPALAAPIVATLTLSQQELDDLRFAVQVAYVDDDAPIYDAPNGHERVLDLKQQLGL